MTSLVRRLIEQPAATSPSTLSFSDPSSPALSVDFVTTGADLASRLEAWSPGRKSLFEVRGFMAEPGPLAITPARKRLSDAAAKDAFAKLFPRAPLRDLGMAAQFGYLMDRWKPIGRSIFEVREVMGVPSEEKPGSVAYHFDTGYGGMTWTLIISDNVVTGVESQGTN